MRELEAAAQPKPRDEAAIRADERRRTERDIAAFYQGILDIESAVPIADKALRSHEMASRLAAVGDAFRCVVREVSTGDYFAHPRTDAPAPAPAPNCTCAEDLRAAAGMLRRTTRPLDPPTAANCRIAAGYDAAAAWLDSPGVAPAADPEGGAPPKATP